MRLVFTFIACRMKILCIICHDLLISSEDIFFTRCGHVFHHRCLLQWLERSETCPQCRAKVTENRIHKAHFTVSNTETVADNADNLSSQSRIDSLKFQILLNEKNIKYYTSKNSILEKQNAGLRQEVRKVESEINQKNSVIYALREQIKHFKEKSEFLRKKLSWEENMHNALSMGTLEDVQEMVGNRTDRNTLLNCISDLKEISLKKTRKIESLRSQLTMHRDSLAEERSKTSEFEQRLAFSESENLSLRHRINQLEKLHKITDQNCIAKSSSQRNSNENSLINVRTVDISTQQVNAKQQTADQNGSSSPEVEIINDTFDDTFECPTVTKKPRLKRLRLSLCLPGNSSDKTNDVTTSEKHYDIIDTLMQE
ncbi:E3 ubiquitin-protein ligase TRAIP-like isoform X1 [Temnothorax nylanderi]|uniref:E3 ubiquitin-protein ligase TRAIP-like isoform X1 n=2 Tax=Temnothorax nylanderi TaxID=102681 RepID=UPI003A86AB08